MSDAPVTRKPFAAVSFNSFSIVEVFVVESTRARRTGTTAAPWAGPCKTMWRLPVVGDDIIAPKPDCWRKAPTGEKPFDARSRRLFSTESSDFRTL